MNREEIEEILKEYEKNYSVADIRISAITNWLLRWQQSLESEIEHRKNTSEALDETQN